MSYHNLHRRMPKPHKDKLCTAYVVIDIAGRPLAKFDTEEDARCFVDLEAHGRRIEQINYDISLKMTNGWR